MQTTAVITQTMNGANALSTSGNPLVDFFMMFVRGIDKDVLSNYLTKCWQMDPKKTIAVIFNARDRVEGKKEKCISNRAMIWLRKHKFNTYCKNLETYVNKFGCWKDVMYTCIKQPNDVSFEVNMIADQLKKDVIAHNEGKSVSLCAKWAPTENDKYDKNCNLAHNLASSLFPDDPTKMMERYRKEYLVPLRKHIDIVESYMTANRWKEIKYDRVPAVATKRLKKAFMKHDPEGYEKYLNAVASGEKKINVTGILPHELTRFYLSNNVTEPDQTIELQWQSIIDNVTTQGKFKDMIAIVDVSGSMFGSNNVNPIDVAVALGILISQCCESAFKNKIISFDETPIVYEIKGKSLFEKIQEIRHNLPAGLSTNFEAVFDLLISSGKMFNIPPEDMPSKIVCLTDMQFNRASHTVNEETLHQTIIKKFEGSPYKPPKIIYWNLSSDHNETFPLKCTSDNAAMISGFSEQLLKVFMTSDDMNPENVVNEILSKYMDDVIIDDDDM